jgi:hypothetical protein
MVTFEQQKSAGGYLVSLSKKRITYFLSLITLILASCPLTDDPLENKIGMDPRLYGVWRFQGGDGVYEEIIISPETVALDSFGTFTYGGTFSQSNGSYAINFKGDIVYAESFSAEDGILIIKYHRTPIDYKQFWLDWSKSSWPHKLVPLDPQPTGDYYGVYFLDMSGDGSRVFLACTNDQLTNSGPTETDTLEGAIAKFTIGNMNQMLDLSVGDPQTKYGDL